MLLFLIFSICHCHDGIVRFALHMSHVCKEKPSSARCKASALLYVPSGSFAVETVTKGPLCSANRQGSTSLAALQRSDFPALKETQYRQLVGGQRP